MLGSLTLPGVVLLLVAVAAVEQVWARRRGRARASAGGMDVLSAVLDPGRAADLEEQRSRAVVRQDVRDGAPPWARDLASGVVVIATSTSP